MEVAMIERVETDGHHARVEARGRVTGTAGSAAPARGSTGMTQAPGPHGPRAGGDAPSCYAKRLNAFDRVWRTLLEGPADRRLWILFVPDELLIETVRADDFQQARRLCEEGWPGRMASGELMNHAGILAEKRRLERQASRSRAIDAVHEAAHAVTASVLGNRVEVVTIRPEILRAGGRPSLAGHSLRRCRHLHPWTEPTHQQWSEMDARSVLIALAGPMGGARARGVAAWAKPNLGRLRGADRAVAFDRARRVPCPRCDAAVEAAAGGCGWACEDMDAWTRRVIRAAWSFGADVLGPAWPAVEAVAAELMSSGEIGGDEVREIIRRSGAVGSTGCVGDRTGGVLAVVSARIDFGGRRRRR